LIEEPIKPTGNAKNNRQLFPTMPLILHKTSVFTHCKGLLIVPVDGIGAGHEGAIGRQYIGLFPQDWKHISNKVQYPIPLGSNRFVECPQGEGYDYLLLASLLNHTGQVSKSDYKGFVFNAVRQAMNLASGFEIQRVASAVLRGGWRLSHDEAFLAMLDAYEHTFSFAKNISFEIHETDQTRFRRIQSLARSLGWTT
jgi:hypothetical protein